MSWQAASFSLLFIALVAGFAWYERSHPPAKVLALVATLAALAALGRVAFAPFPNVKPTTDIVLLSGYALGGAPGFAVGAVAAVASNFFFGQGPWTPWQMAGWGLVGVGGAALGAVSRRRLPRVPLALACAIAGFAYGALLDFSSWVTFAGEHTLGQFVAISGTSFAFNVAHAVGNLVFCLAFGPAFVRALMRFRSRFDITWGPAPAALALLAARLVAAGMGAAATARAGTAAAATDRATSRAVGFLVRAQNPDGGFGAAPRAASSQLYTAWAVLGLAASGRAPAHVRRNGRSPVEYVLGHLSAVHATGDLERTILALAAAGADPRRAGGRNLVSELTHRRGADGSFSEQVNLTAFAVLALRATPRPAHDGVLRTAAAWLARQQNRDGGFNSAGRGGPSGIDDTAAAIEALAAAGRRRSAGVRRGARFIARHQDPDGGFPLTPGAGSNSQSTAWAVQGLLAAGRNPDRVRRGGSRTPLAYLRSLVGPDGAVRYSRTSRQTPVWVTAQALTALARMPFPLR
jgi:energy-coupling factor transport system substrate-specific component